MPAPVSQPSSLTREMRSVAQEFLDALPVHQFEHTAQGWRERMVDVDDGDGPHDFRFVLSPAETPAVEAFLSRRGGIGQPLLDVAVLDVAVGDRLEVCPMAIAVVEDIANRIGNCRWSAAKTRSRLTPLTE